MSAGQGAGVSAAAAAAPKLIVVNTSEGQRGAPPTDHLFRVHRGCQLTLRPGPRCLVPEEASLRTNYPVKKRKKFSRATYHELSLETDHQDLISSSFNWHVTLQLELAGSFHFVLWPNNSSSNDEPPLWESYVVVSPELKIPLDAIKCQTVLSKNLGPLSEWRKRLSVTKEAGYNVIHFTPIQELGASNSAYSLRNQLKPNPLFRASLDDIRKEVEFMDKKWNMLSMTDIVLNHTANDSQWIREHPECAYNLTNSPHLRPAFLLDSAFLWLQADLERGFLERSHSVTCNIKSESDLQAIGVLLRTYYAAQLKIHEFTAINVGDALARFSSLPREQELKVDSSLYERNSAKVLAIPRYILKPEELQKLLEEENLKRRQEFKGLLEYAISNALSAIRYERLDPKGPYFGQPVSHSKPLVAPYFTHTEPKNFQIAQEEAQMLKNGHLFMAHNGWIMGAGGGDQDDFAGPHSQVYLKRELIAWGDCIKLRFGKSADEVPYLWEHMRKYVEAQAKVFHGFRIDNCHSTPLHVAEFVVDVARSVRPDIYIMAELFTDSEATDNKYVNRLALTSLIRESLSANSARELGRLLYRYGGTPVGAFLPQGAEPLKPSTAQAIFFDQTHDNESPIACRSAFDLPATTALINMAACATGSNRGYDELVPHHINVVSEARPYAHQVDLNAGLFPLRRLLNVSLQRELAANFREIFVDQVNDDVIALTRHNPVDGRSIVLVARTAFSKNPGPCHIPTIPIQGHVSRVLLEAQAYGDPEKYTRSEKFINGLEAFKVKIFTSNASPDDARLAKIINHAMDRAEVQFNEFQFLPSSVLAFEVCLTSRQSEALKLLNQWQPELTRFDLNLNDANYILFRCAQEDGQQPYALPNFCQFTYCGLYGLMFYLQTVRDNQDQAHPLAMNLREGNWLSSYLVDRLRRRPTTSGLADHLEGALKQVDVLPRGMVPKHFDLVISKLYNSLLDMIYSRMSVFVSKGPQLVKLLALSSVALIGECQSAPLPPVESKLSYLPSIAAGLPHFSTGFMRNWGRDTFISLRGLLLITGRFAEAKSIILAFARTLRHGLIPNLLHEAGEKARYNCRDAVWWWLYSIREYTKLAPNGPDILRARVKRLHKPEPPAAGLQAQRKRSVVQMNGNGEVCVQYLGDVIQEAIECHFKGMEFVEENAGREIDEHMTDKGFKVTYGVNRETGFVFGGNQHNCGTWMDKMGSSERANTKGKPATPRDGSAVELVGLCKAVVSWLDDMFKNGRHYPYDGVECLYDNTITLKWTWKKWASLIQANFEKYFYIPQLGEKRLMEDPNPELINRHGIYKDSVEASLKWQDYQLRPNFLVAMVVAPELFDRNNARHALEMVKQHLCGPLGMKTLDPMDWNYRGDYDNGIDSDDAKVAHGYNYHNGPEWLWLTGYYIRASSKFQGKAQRAQHLELLANFYATLTESPWLGLPELTNTQGSHCRDSCPIQAWSLATALEALHESVRTNLS